MSITEDKLKRVEELFEGELNAQDMQEAMQLIGGGQYSAEELAEFKLYSDYLPKSKTDSHTQKQRYLHILWETIDRVPLGINCAFSIPFRALIAKHLFKKCGKGFIAYENVHLNFPQLIEVGDYVAWNSGCMLDSKGGITFGNHTMLAEDVTIFTHGHGEDDHVRRTYKPVTIGNHVILGSGSTVLAGVTLHDGAFAGVGAVVTKDVDENIVVTGAPAKPQREARRNGKSLDECNHYFLVDRAFQD